MAARSGGVGTGCCEVSLEPWAPQGEEIIEVWEKDPSVHAFTELLNRGYGKAKDPKHEVDVSGDLVLRWKSNE